jgi:hypothetical protein
VAKKKPRPKQQRAQPKEANGLSPRENLFAKLRRQYPTLESWKIAKMAGFKAKDEQQLKLRAADLLKKERIAHKVYAPATKQEILDKRRIEDMSDEELKLEIKTFLLNLMRAEAHNIEARQRAAVKLGETIRGMFVPIQIDQKTVVTLEDLIREAGGAPAELQAGKRVLELPRPTQEEADA